MRAGCRSRCPDEREELGLGVVFAVVAISLVIRR